MHPLKGILASLLLFALASDGLAQNMNPNGNNNRELLRMGLYPPDLLMQHQERLEITSEQRKKIAALVRDFQGQITELQWAMPSEQQKLRKLLNAPTVDADQALTQAEQVLAMESQFKLAHFDLLIAIKNELSESQVIQLNSVIRRRLSQGGDINRHQR